MSNPTELSDRLEALRAALKQISDTRFGWDGDCGVTSIADEALSADDEADRRAQHAESGKEAWTDERIEELLKAKGGRWQSEGFWIIEDANLHPFVRTIIAKQAVAPGTQQAPGGDGEKEFARGVIAALGVLTPHGYTHGSVLHDEIVSTIGAKVIYRHAEGEDYAWAGLNPRKKPRKRRLAGRST